MPAPVQLEPLTAPPGLLMVWDVRRPHAVTHIHYDAGDVPPHHIAVIAWEMSEHDIKKALP